MPSKARKAFDKNAEDVERLLALHAQVGGDAPGRRVGLEVLNKSAIVLITAIWEAYCEDIASEALAHLVAHSQSANVLSKQIRQQVAKELESDLNELAVWDLADDGWKTILESRLEDLKAKRDRRLNTPKAAEIDQLFLSAIGLDRVSSAWYWPNMPADSAREKLDRYVTLRGAIAHRGQAATHVRKWQVEDFFGHVKKLVGLTGGRVNGFVYKSTQRRLW